MPPKGATVWNEALVSAFEKRADQKRQQGSRHYIGFQQAADKIRAIRKDIYTYSNGRIVNLPKSGLTNTNYELCRSIIAGTEPVTPPGYVETDGNNNNNRNPFENHPYLRVIKIRGGAFAILMAFHVSQRKTMTKDQIIESGQRFCDDQMGENFHAGRMYGAWKGNETLKKHNFLRVNSTVEYREGRGLRAQGKFTYEVTRDGERFTEALLDLHPAVRQEVEATQGNGGAAFDHAFNVHQNFGSARGFQSVRSPSTVPSKRTSQTNPQDISELHSWVETAHVGHQKCFKVGKKRRQHLHDECDKLNRKLSESGRFLQHQSVNDSTRSRVLYVTLMAMDSSTPGLETEVSAPSSPNFCFSSGYGAPVEENSSPSRPKFSPGPGRRLGGSGYGSAASPSKRPRATLATSIQQQRPVARRNLFDSSMSSSDDEVIVIEDTPPPTHRHCKKKTNPEEVIVLEDTKPPARSIQARIMHKSPDDEEVLEDNKPPARSTQSRIYNNKAAGVVVRKGSKSSMPTSKPLKKHTSLPDLSDSDSDDELLYYSPFRTSSVKVPTKSPVTRVKEDVVDWTKSQQDAPRGTTKTEQTPLTIYIDDRERNRNATPRYLRMELQRLVLTPYVQRMCSKSVIGEIQVVEKNLKTGDFAYATGDGLSLSAPPVERKTIGDIVQRSSRKDHWFQLQRMRDSISEDNVCFFLLEGDFRTCVQYPTGSASQYENSGPDLHTIDSEESLIRFIGRAILSTHKVRFAQTKEVQGSLRSIAAIGLVTAYNFRDCKEVKDISAASMRSNLLSLLREGGLPWELASCLADEVGSRDHLMALYSTMDGEECQKQVLAPILAEASERIELKGSAMGWSRAVYKITHSVLEHTMLGKQKFEKYKDLVENHALLLESLHTFVSTEEAVNNVYDSINDETPDSPRRVIISAPAEYSQWFPQSSGASVFDSATHSNVEKIPCVTMHTTAGLFRSNKLALFILEGKALVGRLQTSIMNSQQADVVASALCTAASIRFDCCHSTLFDQKTDTCVAIVRGLTAAMDAWAKQPGYRSEFRLAIDIVLAELSVAHETVVLQAVRLKEDLEIMLRQLALSCFHYQLLTQRVH